MTQGEWPDSSRPHHNGPHFGGPGGEGDPATVAGPRVPATGAPVEPPARPRRFGLRVTLAVGLALLVGLAAGVFITRQDPAKNPAAQTAPDTPSSQSAAPASEEMGGAASPTPSGADRLGAAPLTPRPSSIQPRPGGGSRPGGWPGPDNTGVPAGVVLKASGSITVKKAGTVIDKLDVGGCITVQASNVTIKRTRVRGTCPSGSISTSDYNKYTGILIEDVEVDGLNQSTNNPLVAYSGFTCRRCNLHGGGTGIRMGRSVVVEDSWIHDSHTGGESHNAAIAGHGSNTFVLKHSRLECLDTVHCSSALSLYNDDAEVYDVLAEGNLFSGGGYCVYGGAFGGKGRNVRFIDNVFSRTPYQKCGQYGPVTQWEPGRGNQWSGNHWSDNPRSLVSPT